MKIKKIYKNKIKSPLKGVSIIEALVLIFIFSVAALSFYSVFSVGSRYIINSKNKIIAVSLANERMEMLRNLAYDDIATVGGVPNGLIDPDEEIVLYDKTFRVFTDVKYYDDPYDGIKDGSPNDSVPNDYKIVKVSVYWGGEKELAKIEESIKKGEGAVLSSRFVPPGVEVDVGGGTFSINSIDSAGNPVSGVAVNIFNNQLSPVVNYSTSTDSNGNLLLQGVVADIAQNYKITMSKSGYETVVTYPPSGAGFLPKDVHSNILEGVVNEKTMIIDLLSNMELDSKDVFGASISDVSFKMIGGRRLDDSTVEPGVYSYMESDSTNESGDFSVSNIIPGKYTLSDFSFASGDYEFRKVDLGIDSDPFSFNVVPGTTFDADFIFMDKSIDSAYIKVLDSITATILPGAEVKLKNVTLGYEATLVTDKYGYVYFPLEIASPLVNGETYEIIVTAAGYKDKTDSIVINKFTAKSVSLEII